MYNLYITGSSERLEQNMQYMVLNTWCYQICIHGIKIWLTSYLKCLLKCMDCHLVRWHLYTYYI